MNKVGFQAFLSYRNFYWLKATLFGLALAIGAYWWLDPVGGRSGGSWYGYTTGGIAAALILWLTWFGARKRAYASGSANLRNWLSAHVYLGLGLLLLVPLHSAFQFGWNLHTLAYALMAGVILSGIVGVIFYGAIPSAMTRNRQGQEIESLYRQISDIDAEWRDMARAMPDFVAEATQVGVEETHIGGGILRQLSGDDPRCGTARALAMIEKREAAMGGEQREQISQLKKLIGRKQVLLRRVRRDARHRALLNLWLTFHVPLALATVAAVAVHVFSVFYYR